MMKIVMTITASIYLAEVLTSPNDCTYQKDTLLS